MKKLIIFLVAVIAIGLVCLYTIVPTKLNISAVSYIQCPDNAATRFLADESRWKLWWPDSVAMVNNAVSKGGFAGTNTDGSFFYGGTTFTIAQKTFNGAVLSTSFAGEKITGNLVHAASSPDSLAVILQYATTLSLNPLKRIEQYQEAQKLKKNSSAILNHLKSFLENRENVYGIVIKEIRVTDTLLMSTFFMSPTYPSVDAIYTSINKLKTYIAANGSQETGFPMLNVTVIDSTHFKIRVGIPVNKALKENADMQLKKMIPGRILVTEIKGGLQAIKNAYAQLHYYLADYDLSSPAIPFESLISNRVQEKDSSKWITRIYYPIL
ncbi:MAG: GyrI-like domain-containing protein [Bacteroidota bacterium]